MTRPDREDSRQGRLDALASLHNGRWRDPAQIAAQWAPADELDPRLLDQHARGAFWETVARAGVTLFVTREYEHLVLALRADDRGPHLSYLVLPHPSGLVADRVRNVVHIASTRNPNQVFELAPAAGMMERLDVPPMETAKQLVPVRSRFLPGCLYLHDLALIGDVLHGNAVGENAVVRFESDGAVRRVWWPRSIERRDGPAFGRNYLQLNSIAAGKDLASSYFSASSARIARYRPGHQRFPVDRTGVIFAGGTREPAASGLTRPHSARWNQGKVWVDNSGYGEVGFAENGRFEPVARLPGWTRGLCFCGGVAFVGTSRVIPRFRAYAPGLDVDSSICALHALDWASGQVLGSLIWPWGNQIFAIDWLPRDVSSGFPWLAGRKTPARTRRLFYAFKTALNP